MGTTGLIYLAIAAAWLAYLIPHYLKKREEEAGDQQADPSERFSNSVRIIRTGAAPVLDHEYAAMDVEISTPLTRRAAVAELRRSECRAATRRRRVLTVLLVSSTAVLAVCLAGLLPWWTVAIPGGLVLVFAGIARISVRVMRRSFDARYELITRGSDETTVFLSRKAIAKSLDEVVSVAEVGPAAKEHTGGLWEPLPITLPTYVSKPLAPRTVRTIDLSAPDVTSSARVAVPVTADAPGDETASDASAPTRRAVGE
ncbi:MAG: divisome protein SepX/GlpR [Propionibacteriaceae bacterium]